MAPARTPARHVDSNLTRWIWLIVLALFVHAQLAAGCGSDPDTWEPEPPDTTLQRELEAFAEWGLENLLPPPLPPEQIEIEAVIQHRRQVAATMDDRMAEALVPLAIAVAMFVPDGPVDVLLSVVPVHKLGAAAKAAQKGLRARRRSKRANELAAHATKFLQALPADIAPVYKLIEALPAGERRALARIAAHTGSPNTSYMLLRRHLDHQADIVWIADVVKRWDRLDKEAAKRFTFHLDLDFAIDYTNFDAVPSWAALKAVTERTAISASDRSWLLKKLQGFVGERAARALFYDPGTDFAAKFLQRADTTKDKQRIVLQAYQSGLPYGRRHLDIVASTDGATAVVAEVKNWGGVGWQIDALRDKVLAQLRAHNGGIEQLRQATTIAPAIRHKVLMVAKPGWETFRAEAAVDLEAFEAAVNALGWKIYEIPETDLLEADKFIDNVQVLKGISSLEELE